MRVLFLLILLAGVAIGIVYPWAAGGLDAGEIGSWRVYDEGGGFVPVETKLAPADAPVHVVVELTATAERIDGSGDAVLTVTATSGGDTVLAEALNFTNSSPREISPQLADRMFREEAGVIAPVEEAAYEFRVGSGDAGGVPIRAVDLILEGSGEAADPRAQPLGFSMIAVGFIGLVLAFRRGRPGNPNSQPPPRWGRGGARRR